MLDNISGKIKNLLLILLGNTIYCLGLVTFILPNKIITGGTTGLALTFEHYFGIPIAAFAMIFNVLMFVLGMIVLGKRFAFTTLVSTFYYPIILKILQDIPALSNVTHDRMLSTICAGFMIGAGIGVVIRAGASTGGMDIPPLVLNKKFGLPVSLMLYIFDFTILIMQMLYSNVEEIIYGIVLVLIYSIVLDKVLFMGTSQTEVKIVSKHYELINSKILNELDRGSTFLHAQTGFLGIEQPMVLTVISNRELVKLKQIVMHADPDAFMIVGHVNEVKGRGYSTNKKYLEEPEISNKPEPINDLVNDMINS